MFLLDTNVISELRKAKSGKADNHVIAWAESLPVSSLYLSVITVLELEMGVLLVERRDSKQGTALRSWLDEQLLPAFSERIIDVNTAIAQCCAKLHVPNPCSERDAMIAATAIVYGMTVVTRNVKDFTSSSVNILNPWD